MDKIKIAARGSKLSIAQVEIVSKFLENKGYETEFIEVKTKADLFNNEPLYKLGKGVFEKEVNEYVIKGIADIAVHSMKDLTSIIDPNLEIIAVTKRDSPFDVLLADKELYDLDSGKTIGTSSIRRQNFLKFIRDDLKIKDLRGNIDTRIEKYKKGEYDGIIIAEASILRLKYRIKYFRLDPLNFTPEANQGIIAVVGKKTNLEIKKILSELNDQDTLEEAIAERSTMQIVGGGCHSPFGVYFKKQSNNEFQGIASFSNSKKKITIVLEKSGKPEELGIELGKLLLKEMKYENIIPST
ncbi:hydroxymethylbilane synthase [Acidianus sulfidivorans JP7]|uniref:Hydroxymethylbilane synthase n=1 Tax=Acidianus sulfidivorans JP7 TaxID=619593 RepID=A0A2U9IMU0_9CREN|nr:hydroxymethylbilane synthase [Acidianus sulfidivorans]AWR97343.1 hydroxymethylbilane synthase [Acidianus sulfidivorans JP7]